MILEAILNMGHFPAGMEAFPASNESAWNLIERVISDSDYYVLIIGGRYGSCDAEGISYTEKEYDLAVKLKIPVLAFIHGAPGGLSFNKSEPNQGAREKLKKFRKKVEGPHTCKYWELASDLNGKIYPALLNGFLMFPAKGWVKDTGESVEELNSRLVALQKKYDLANERLGELEKNLQDEHHFFREGHTLELVIDAEIAFSKSEEKAIVTWAAIFVQISAGLLGGMDRYEIGAKLADLVFRELHGDQYSAELRVCTESSVDAVINQLGAARLVDCSTDDNSRRESMAAQIFGRFSRNFNVWKLTASGKQKHFRISARPLSEGPGITNFVN